jgi:hypothetical protein
MKEELKQHWNYKDRSMVLLLVNVESLKLCVYLKIIEDLS